MKIIIKKINGSYGEDLQTENGGYITQGGYQNEKIKEFNLMSSSLVFYKLWGE